MVFRMTILELKYFGEDFGVVFSLVLVKFLSPKNIVCIFCAYSCQSLNRLVQATWRGDSGNQCNCMATLIDYILIPLDFWTMVHALALKLIVIPSYPEVSKYNQSRWPSNCTMVTTLRRNSSTEPISQSVEKEMFLWQNVSKVTSVFRVSETFCCHSIIFSLLPEVFAPFCPWLSCVCGVTDEVCHVYQAFLSPRMAVTPLLHLLQLTKGCFILLGQDGLWKKETMQPGMQAVIMGLAKAVFFLVRS